MTEIRPGCEPLSSPGFGPNANTGILLLHGFTGSPASMRPLADDLAARGFTVEMPLMPGHGTTWKDLVKVTWRDYARETVAAFERLKAGSQRQIAVGLSNGGLIALRLAQTRTDDLEGVVLINPFLASKDRRLKALPVLKMLVPSLPGVANDIAKPDMDEIAYDRLPLRALSSTLELQRIVTAALPDMRTPTLLFTSRVDHTIGTYSSELIAERIGSPDFEHVWLERSYHVATLDYDYPEILEGTVKFAERVAAQR